MPDPATPRILVVDDEEAILYVFERYLSIAGYRVVIAGSGADAVRAGEAGPFDLLITDFRMPGMNGVEVIHALRRLQPALPALVISANPIEAGTMPEGVHFLSKPVSMADLLELVSSLIAHPRID
ncbi:response regulator [Massilia putida]|uniref:response regulator n=1 Tax=Massilia putida TaxID=1141883 RepID=UPI0009530EC8|nr:response regulator [Massilia putida]